MALAAGGGAQAQGAVTRMYVDMVLHTENHVRVNRQFCVGSHAQLLREVHAAYRSAVDCFGSEVASIDLSPCSAAKFRKTYSRAVYFTNICGKVVHCHVAHTINPGVQPLVHKVVNGFGRFSALFGPHCNLLTSSTNTVTLFRAARRSRDVFSALEHAINPDSVASIALHMLVATARVAHPIILQCAFVDAVFARDDRWTAVTVLKTEEGAHMKSIALSGLSPAWVRSIADGLQVPSKILVNLTKNGAINMFMSIDDAFVVDMEFKYIPLCDVLVSLVNRYT